LTAPDSDLASAVSEFLSYKPDADKSASVPSGEIFDRYAHLGSETQKAPISTFASLVKCPYRVVNIGAGHRPYFSREMRTWMQEGSKAHKTAEEEIHQEVARSIEAGGPGDLRRSSREIVDSAAEDLLEAPEVKVKLGVGDLALSGRVDGLLRKDGIVIAVERKPKTGVYQPASRLQAMTYAIGGCLAFEKADASRAAHWLVTDYKGNVGPRGDITGYAVDLFDRLGSTYLQLLDVGQSGSSVIDLPGPAYSKCTHCEFRGRCAYRIDEKPEPIRKGGQSTFLKKWGEPGFFASVRAVARRTSCQGFS